MTEPNDNTDDGPFTFMNSFEDSIDRDRYYTATYSCGNRVSLSNDQDPPAECPDCGETLVRADRESGDA